MGRGCPFSSVSFEALSEILAFPLQSLRSLTGSEIMGYDVVILSDLLHFHSSHNVLITSLKSLLRKTADSRVYIAVRSCLPMTLQYCALKIHRLEDTHLPTFATTS